MPVVASPAPNGAQNPGVSGGPQGELTCPQQIYFLLTPKDRSTRDAYVYMERDKAFRHRIRQNAAKIRRGKRNPVDAAAAIADFGRIAAKGANSLDVKKTGRTVKGLKVITNRECVERCLASRPSAQTAFTQACTQLCADVGSTCNGCRGFRSTCQHYLRYQAPAATELCTQTYADLGCPGRW